MNFSCISDLYIGLQILSPMNTKKEPNLAKKLMFFHLAFGRCKLYFDLFSAY
jgi:hypothetical protein